MATNRNKSVRLNGINPLSYIGVNPYTPADSRVYQRDPTPQDKDGFFPCDVWLNQQDQPANPLVYKIWMLVSKQNNIAKWVLIGNGNGNDLISLTGDTGTNPVFGDVNENINIVGGVGITYGRRTCIK